MVVNKPASIIKMVWHWLPVAICMGLIFWGSSVPGKEIPYLFGFQDIVFHFAVYFVLTLFFCRALRKTYPEIPPAKLMLFGLAFGFFYGLMDEFHQSFVPQRSVSGLDLFIDGIASLLGGSIHR